MSVPGFNWSEAEVKEFNHAVKHMPPQYAGKELRVLQGYLHEKPREEVARIYDAYLFNKAGFFDELDEDLPPKSNNKAKKSSWNDEECDKFTKGLEELGWGDWQGIAEKFVRTKTNKQVWSQAKNYLKKFPGAREQYPTKSKSKLQVRDQATDDVIDLDTETEENQRYQTQEKDLGIEQVEKDLTIEEVEKDLGIEQVEKEVEKDLGTEEEKNQSI